MRDVLAFLVMTVLTIALILGFLNILAALTVVCLVGLAIVIMALPFVWVYKKWRAWSLDRRVAPIRESLDAYIEATDPEIPKWQGVNRISKYYEDAI